MAKLADTGTFNVTCPKCGEHVAIPYRTTGSHVAERALVVEFTVDSIPMQTHPCLLNAQHAEWSDEMDNTYPVWP